MRLQVVFALLLLVLEGIILFLVSDEPLLIIYLAVLTGISLLHSSLVKNYKPMFGILISSISLFLIFTVENHHQILLLWCVISLHIWYLDYCLSLHESSSEPVMKTLIMVSGFVPCWYAINEVPNASFQQGLFLSLGSFTVLIVSWLSVQADFGNSKKPAGWLMIKLMFILSICLLVSFNAGDFVYSKPIRSFFARWQTPLNLEDDLELARRLAGLKKKSDDFFLNTDSTKAGNEVNAFVQQIIEPGKPRLRLPLYLRRAGYAQFNGNKWLLTKTSNDNWVYDAEDGKTDGWSVLGGYATNLTADYVVYLAEPGSPALLCLPGTVAVGLPRIFKGSDQTFRMERPSRDMIAYTAHAYIIKFSDIENRNLQPGNTGKQYLEIPKSPLMERVKKDSERIVGGDSSTTGKIAKLKNYMQANFAYKQKLEKPKPNMLENFLFGERKGNCTLFATAFALYLRAAGIPSRVGTGFCSSTFDKKEDVYVFYNDDAHAWTEVFFKDYGWVIVDATPPENNPSKVSRYHDFASAKDDFMYISGADAMANRFEGIMNKEKAVVQNTGPYLYLLIFICSLIGIIYLMLKSLYRVKKEDMLKNLGGMPSRELSFFMYFCRHFAEKGCRRKKGETVIEYFGKLKQRQLLGDEFDDLIPYYYAVKYEGSPSSAEFEESVIAKIRQIGKEQ